jgi:transcription termination factor Rho
MPNETRPRRESNGNPRPRKSASGDTTPPAYGEHHPHPATPSGGDPGPLYRDRGERAPVRPDERPADHEPARQRDRDAAPVLGARDRVDRIDRDRDREPAPSSLRERLARDRAERLARQGSPPATTSHPIGEREPAPYPPHVRDARSPQPEPRTPAFVDEPFDDPEDPDDELFGDSEIHDRYEDIKRGEIYLTELQKMTMPQLLGTAKAEGITEYSGLKKQDLIFKILKERVKQNGLMYGEGTLEVLPDGFGFLRSPDYNYLPCPDDIYVSPSQIRRFGLKTGAIVSGQIRPPKENERYFALLRVEMINFEEPDKLSEHVSFDDLSATHPSSRLQLASEPHADSCLRILDLLTPIGKGQRGLIVAPPHSGKTVLIEKVAASLLTHYPDTYVIVLLIDERPEEVTAMEQALKFPSAEVISSTFDEPATRHIQVAEMVIEKAKRMVEYGKDVVILLDSLTRLARAYHTESTPAGKPLGSAIDTSAIQKPKRFFASARAVEGAGSLTILATALVETGSRFDDLVFDEFRGTGNTEIHLDRHLADRRIWPAIDLSRSGTRREERLQDPDDLNKVWLLRRALTDLDPSEAIEEICSRLAVTPSNREFLDSLNLSS